MQKTHGMRCGAWIGRGLGLLVLVLACAEAKSGAFLARVEAVAGQWDLSLENTYRRCRLTLRADVAGAGGQVLAMPAGCRRSLPILATIESWSLPGDDHLDLTDSTGRSVHDFSARDGEMLSASGPQGEIYRLAAVPIPGMGLVAAGQGGPRPGSEPVKVAAKTEPKVAPPRSADTAGRYAILREGGKETGCMLTLDDKIRGRGGDKATLAPACRDQGIVIFDPVGWQIINGQLVLTARKGHTTHLDRQPDGTWLKDPKDGKSLGLKRL